MELKQIASYILKRLKKGILYKKAGKEISQNSSKSLNNLCIGTRIEYNVRSTFHSVK